MPLPSPLNLLTLLTTLLFLTTSTSAQTPPHSTYLNITALTHRDNTSILQCWSLIPPFSTSNTGPVGASALNLGGISGNASYIVQAPGSVGGYKNAPRAQFSLLLTGLIHITLPYSTNPNPSELSTYVTGGRYGLIYADDVYTDGHSTTFPGPDDTVLLAIPVAGGVQPEHVVVREGGCLWGDLVRG